MRGAIIIFIILFIGISTTSAKLEDDYLLNLFNKSTWNAQKDSILVKMYIQKVYNGNVKNTLKIIKLITQFPSKDQRSLGFRFLFDELVSSKDVLTSEMMSIVYNVQRYFGKTSNEEVIEYIKANVPERIWDFPFRYTTFRFKNSEYSSYLFVNKTDKSYSIDDYRQMVTTYSSPVDGTRWRLEPDLYGTSFKIFNARDIGYMYADVNKLDEDRRHVLFWKKYEQVEFGGEWIIEPYAWYQSCHGFRLRNAYWGEYLYPYSPESTYRKVLLFKYFTSDRNGNTCQYVWNPEFI